MKKPGVRKRARFLYVSKVSNDSGGYHVMRVIANHQPSLTLSMVAFLRFGDLICRFTLMPVLLW